MKKLVIAASMILVSMLLVADTCKVGDYTYTYELRTVNSNTTARIYGYTDYSYVEKTLIDPIPTNSISIPSRLPYVESNPEMYGYPVSAIDGYAFVRCTALTELFMPDSVMVIGEFAMSGCHGLTNIVFSSNLTSIGRRAFANCYGLTSISLPDSVKTIDGAAFMYCSSLKKVRLSRNLVTLGPCAFWQCTSLQDIELPLGITILDEGVLQGCSSLTNVVLSPSIRKIGYRALCGCDRLQSVAIPPCVTTISEEAFYNSIGLTNIVIPASVMTVEDAAFRDCRALEEVVLSTNMTSIADELFKRCTSLAHVDIPNGVISIGNEAFYGCTNLKSITIPKSVTTIRGDAFYNCTSLTNVTIGTGVASIGNYAFRYCNKIGKVTALGPMPTSGVDYLPRVSGTTKYVVTAEHFASWLPWLVQNKLGYAILDEETQQEIRVVVGGDAMEAVGVAASLGLSPARTEDGGEVVVTYAVPTLSIESFDPVAGRVDVLVTPADGCAVTGDLVTDCVSVEWSDDLAVWASLSGIHVDAASYRAEGTKGRFTCTFDASEHGFYKVKVRGQ